KLDENCGLRYAALTPSEIKVKVEFYEEYGTIIVFKNPVGWSCSLEPMLLKKAYTKCLPISKAKKDNLMSMCLEKGLEPALMPRCFHDFYKGLPVSMRACDCIAEPADNKTDYDSK
uniref:Uncharacterized protein n=1 Tax=Romanomermis culicivorax TaxID=13658 RepID=A0A915J8G0_ROMCU